MERKLTTFLAQDAQKQMNTLRHLVFHDILTLDSAQNTLTWWPEQKTIPLNEAQKRFFSCLLLRITSKRQIIATVWNESYPGISDNNYHQLLFQSRALLKRYGLPDGLLVTLPYHGVRLNEEKLMAITR
ncbi:response regulator [Pantoea dispersa EGD-AAK13]|jgi:DNA-binding winged helix-turn-helix (wHTH) protein|uniref:Response regulator n=2 Tax=Pantoea dispersa TaxID=59814 RepID=A0A8E1RWT7_9GAMM|nr:MULTISPECIES: transcriptional regulator [Pantoea]KAF0856880.1 response regulator [Pantoea dispersa 625]MBK4768702.1 response regulator [Pantoea sp. Morm]ERH64195.1 response regulator [Pantoea dispersa EGD-AAK13]KAA6099099.1 response regulator [Pantoea sp. B_9]KAA6115319.1 response regulator [Pantoea sp. B_10]